MTGGASGFGLEIARRMREAGSLVVILDATGVALNIDGDTRLGFIPAMG